jgi:hypothetical protein
VCWDVAGQPHAWWVQEGSQGADSAGRSRLSGVRSLTVAQHPQNLCRHDTNTPPQTPPTTAAAQPTPTPTRTHPLPTAWPLAAAARQGRRHAAASQPAPLRPALPAAARMAMPQQHPGRRCQRRQAQRQRREQARALPAQSPVQRGAATEACARLCLPWLLLLLLLLQRRRTLPVPAAPAAARAAGVRPLRRLPRPPAALP